MHVQVTVMGVLSFDKEKDKPTMHILSVTDSWSIIALADKYNLFIINVHIMKDIVLCFIAFSVPCVNACTFKKICSTKNNLSAASAIIIVSLTLTYCHIIPSLDFVIFDPEVGHSHFVPDILTHSKPQLLKHFWHFWQLQIYTTNSQANQNKCACPR